MPTLTPATTKVFSISVAGDPGLYPGASLFPDTTLYPDQGFPSTAVIRPYPTKTNFECVCGVVRTCDPNVPCNMPTYMEVAGLELYPDVTLFPDVNLYPL